MIIIYVCLYIMWLYVCLTVFLSLSMYECTCMSVCLSVCLYVCLSVFLSVCLFAHWMPVITQTCQSYICLAYTGLWVLWFCGLNFLGIFLFICCILKIELYSNEIWMASFVDIMYEQNCTINYDQIVIF